MRGRLLALVAVVALVVTGCRLDVDVAVVMDRDGAGTVTVTATADAELVARAPGLGADLRLDDFANAGWSVDGPTATDDGGLQVVLSHPFESPSEATALVASLNGAGGPFQGLELTRTVDGKTVSYAAAGTLQVTGGIDAFADQQVQALGAGTPFAGLLAQQGIQLDDALGITLQVQLPVDADTTNGTRTDDSVSWEVPVDGSVTQVQLTAESSPSSTAKRLLALLALAVFVGWLVVAGSFVAYVLRQRRRTHTA